MVLCPVAVAVGCQKCPVFKVCPAKSILGDQPKDKAPAAGRKEDAAAGADKKK